MAPKLLTVPSELCLRVYRHLLPTLNTETSPNYNIRLVCRQIKTEFDHEVVKDISNYHAGMIEEAANNPVPTSIEIQEAATFEETRKLMITTSFPETMCRPNLELKCLSGIIPHVRLITVKPHRALTQDDSEYTAHREGYHDWRWIIRQAYVVYCGRLVGHGIRCPSVVLYHGELDRYAMRPMSYRLQPFNACVREQNFQDPTNTTLRGSIYVLTMNNW